jgi:hypothetical protein
MRVPHVSRDVGTPSNDELERQSRPVGSRTLWVVARIPNGERGGANLEALSVQVAIESGRKNG